MPTPRRRARSSPRRWRRPARAARPATPASRWRPAPRPPPRRSAGSAPTPTRPTRRGGAGGHGEPGLEQRHPGRSPATSRAIGPTVSRLGASGHTPSAGSGPRWSSARRSRSRRPGCGSSRRCPSRSATSASPLATATAEPLDEPPGTRAGSSGLTGVPNAGVDPADPVGQFVQIGLADETRLAAGHGGAQPGQAGRRRWPRAARARDRPAARRGGQPGHVDEVLDRDPQAGSAAVLRADPHRHSRQVWHRRIMTALSFPARPEGRG